MPEPKAVILCVDDEENPLILRKLVLQKAGYAVLAARSGTEALEITNSQEVDLVLSDQLMPGITGVELARRVKLEHPDLPVILLSGVNEIPVGADSADAFLSKLEGPDGLCREIHALLNAAGRTKRHSLSSSSDGHPH
jgi:two-component system, cell cycle sensor histidine kinase and response regulator CckA